MRTSFFFLVATRLLPVAMGVLLTCGAAAQLPGNGGTTGGPPAPQATTVPLDGGASLLLAAGLGLGLGLGLRRLRRRPQS